MEPIPASAGRNRPVHYAGRNLQLLAANAPRREDSSSFRLAETRRVQGRGRGGCDRLCECVDRAGALSSPRRDHRTRRAGASATGVGSSVLDARWRARFVTGRQVLQIRAKAQRRS